MYMLQHISARWKHLCFSSSFDCAGMACKEASFVKSNFHFSVALFIVFKDSPITFKKISRGLDPAKLLMSTGLLMYLKKVLKCFARLSVLSLRCLNMLRGVN